MTEGKSARNISGRTYRNSNGKLIRNTATCDGCSCTACQSSVLVNAFPEDNPRILARWTPWYMTTGTQPNGSYPAFIDVTVSGVINGTYPGTDPLAGLKVTCAFLDGIFTPSEPGEPEWKWSCQNAITWCGFKTLESPITAEKLDGSGSYDINNIYVKVQVKMSFDGAASQMPDCDLCPCQFSENFRPITEVTIMTNVSTAEDGTVTGDVVFDGYEDSCFQVDSTGLWSGPYDVTPGPSIHSPWGSHWATVDAGQCHYWFDNPNVFVGPMDIGECAGIPGAGADFTDKNCLSCAKYRKVTISCTPATEGDTCRTTPCGGAYPVCCKRYDVTLFPLDGSPIKTITNPTQLNWQPADGIWSGTVTMAGCFKCVDSCWSPLTRVKLPSIQMTACSTVSDLLGTGNAQSQFNGFNPTELRFFDAGTTDLEGYVGTPPGGINPQLWWMEETGWHLLTSDWRNSSGDVVADGTWYYNIYILVKYECSTGKWTITKEALIKSDDTTYGGYTAGTIYSDGAITYSQSTGTGSTGSDSFDTADGGLFVTLCSLPVEDVFTDKSTIYVHFSDDDRYKNICDDVDALDCDSYTSGYLEIRCVIDSETFNPMWRMTFIVGGNYMIWQATGALTPEDGGYCPPAPLTNGAAGQGWDLVHSDWDATRMPNGAVTFYSIDSTGCMANDSLADLPPT